MNLFDDLPPSLPEEWTSVLLQRGGMRIERIVSHGHASPAGFWYDQDEAEWVLLLAGAATLRWTDGRELMLRPGDWTHLPAHERHRVEWTTPDGPTIWLAVFYRDEA